MYTTHTNFNDLSKKIKTIAQSNKYKSSSIIMMMSSTTYSIKRLKINAKKEVNMRIDWGVSCVLLLLFLRFFRNYQMIVLQTQRIIFGIRKYLIIIYTWQLVSIRQGSSLVKLRKQGIQEQRG